MQYAVDSQQFDSDWDSMIQLLLEMGVRNANLEVVDSEKRPGFSPALRIIGIYISLFLLTIHLLFRRRKSFGMKFLIVASCIMAVLGTAQMAITIAQTVIAAHFVQQAVHSQVLNEHESVQLSSVRDHREGHCVHKHCYRCYVIRGFWKKIVIVPALLMLSTFVMGIVGTTTLNGAVEDVTQITFGLAAATNLVLTALTGKSIYSIVDSPTFNAERLVQLVGYCGSGVQHCMLVLPAHSAVVTTQPLESYSSLAQYIVLRQYSWLLLSHYMI
ncbi:hypothetical protein B0H13DRAFT_1874124 [Mycena leptocephala]|nr:hypothetical protein B0H13DRAFT_1874124 [Mycena leptocephala]